MSVNLKGSREYKGYLLSDPNPGKPVLAEDEGGALSTLVEWVGNLDVAGDWSARHARGDVSPALATAQAALDRAVEGGFFDDFEGRPLADEGAVEVRREIQAAALALLEDPDVEVWLHEERFRDPVEGSAKWRTRLLAIPRSR